VLVREIRVTGSTVFSAEELARVTGPYANRELTAEDLEALRVALTRLYIDKGYINSGAVLPDQAVADGVVTFQIVEGRLTDINIEGNRWFRSAYLRRRLALDTGPPLNVQSLQQRLQLLLEDSRLQSLNAELKPGLRPGESELDVRAEDRQPFRLFLDVDNYQPPALGAERGIVTLEDQNLTGNGDLLSLGYGRSAGVNPILDFKYALPVTAYDTTLSFEYRKNTFTVIEAPFTNLRLDSDSDIYTVTLRQPVYRTLHSEFALELTGERLSQQTTVLGEDFSLSPGAHNGEAVVTALRAAQEWVTRTQDQVFAIRSRFSLGLDALGATINKDDVPDGRFFAWLGQFQWVQRLAWLDAELIGRAALQISDRPLLVLEQVAVGGRYSVRGYRENTLVRDDAFLASLEARVPIVRNRRWAEYLQLAPFVDYGRAWNTKIPTPDPNDLVSVGIGLRWAVTLSSSPVAVRPQFEIYWGHPLRTVDTPGGDLQDSGVHFQFVLAFF
jgi:hemolysin activation/secretion protein